MKSCNVNDEHQLAFRQSLSCTTQLPTYMPQDAEFRYDIVPILGVIIKDSPSISQ